jgi:hypothetical protein
MSLHLPYTRYTRYMGSCRLFAVYCLGKHSHSRDVLKVKMKLIFLKNSYGIDNYESYKNEFARCWRSLMLIINHLLLHEIAWNEPQSIVVGLGFNEFHEFCCSHLFCRIFNISLYKSISSDKLKHIIAKSSSRRSKQIYHSLYLEFWRESPRGIGRF